MRIGIKVGDIMIRNFISAKPDIMLLDAVKLMVKKRIGSLILTEKDILRGILTEKDIMWALSKKRDLTNVNAIDICTRKITTIKPSADIYDAVKIMKKAKFRRLPVTINKKVIGYLTLKDILKISPELFEIAKEGYTIRETEEKSEKRDDRKSFNEGICEGCGNFNILSNHEGKLTCESCIDNVQ